MLEDRPGAWREDHETGIGVVNFKAIPSRHGEITGR